MDQHYLIDVINNNIYSIQCLITNNNFNGVIFNIINFFVTNTKLLKGGISKSAPTRKMSLTPGLNICVYV